MLNQSAVGGGDQTADERLGQSDAAAADVVGLLMSDEDANGCPDLIIIIIIIIIITRQTAPSAVA